MCRLRLASLYVSAKFLQCRTQLVIYKLFFKGHFFNLANGRCLREFTLDRTLHYPELCDCAITEICIDALEKLWRDMLDFQGSRPLHAKNKSCTRAPMRRRSRLIFFLDMRLITSSRPNQAFRG